MATDTKKILELLGKDVKTAQDAVTVFNKLTTLEHKTTAVQNANSTVPNKNAVEQLEKCKGTIYGILRECLTPAPTEVPFAAPKS